MYLETKEYVSTVCRYFFFFFFSSFSLFSFFFVSFFFFFFCLFLFVARFHREMSELSLQVEGLEISLSFLFLVFSHIEVVIVQTIESLAYAGARCPEVIRVSFQNSFATSTLLHFYVFSSM